MWTAIWIILGIIGLLLLVWASAGVCVLIASWRFRSAPDRETVLAIIREYQERFRADEERVQQLANSKSRREVIERDGVSYSVSLTAWRAKSPSAYKITISVGRLRRIVFGHAELIDVTFPAHD